MTATISSLQFLLLPEKPHVAPKTQSRWVCRLCGLHSPDWVLFPRASLAKALEVTRWVWGSSGKTTQRGP